MENILNLKLVVKQHKFINEENLNPKNFKIYYKIYVYKIENNEYTFIGNLKENDVPNESLNDYINSEITKNLISREFFYNYYKQPILEIKEIEYEPLEIKTLLYCVINTKEILSDEKDKFLINWNIDIYHNEPNGYYITKVFNNFAESIDEIKNDLKHRNFHFNDEIKKEYIKHYTVDINSLSIKYEFNDNVTIDYLIEFNKQYIIKKVSENNSNPKNYPLKLVPVLIPEFINKHHKDFSNNNILLVSSENGLKLVNKYDFLLNYEINE